MRFGHASSSNQLVSLLILVVFLSLGCTDGGGSASDADRNATARSETLAADLAASSSHAERVAALLGLVGPDTGGVTAIDFEALTNAGVAGRANSAMVDQLDPFLAELLRGIDEQATLLAATEATTVVVVDPVDQAQGRAVLAVVADPSAAAGQATTLPGDVVALGDTDTVALLLEGADGATRSGAPLLDDFGNSLDPTAPVAFLHALPGLDAGPAGAFDNTLRSAVAVTGRIGLDGAASGSGAFRGTLTFHHPSGSTFVETFNALNVAATSGDNPTEVSLALGASVSGGLDQIVVELPPTPMVPGTDEPPVLRNFIKKLTVGMEAWAYAEGVDPTDGGPENPAWLDLVVKSERDGDEPPSPGSVFLRWEFKDPAAIEAFEQNELPDGFTLAPTRFFETDAETGEYFLALNLYNSGGGSIVAGARAEWDVFVNPPEGADPDAGARPRFMVVDALAEEISADPGNLLTPAEPLSHALIDGVVATSVQKFNEAGVIEPVFSSLFAVPDPTTAEVARFTREMAIGNDYIYWEHGVHDRVVYNATTFNHDAYFVDPSQVLVVDNSKWAQYLKPELKDVVYYVNTLEYVASPMANLDGDFLDLTPDWLTKLDEFKNNGHQSGLMRTAVEQLFRGSADAFVGRALRNDDAPSTFYHFRITDPDGFEQVANLPTDRQLGAISLYDGDRPGYYLTLAFRDYAEATDGVRAEWLTYTRPIEETDTDSIRPPSQFVLNRASEHTGFDPTTILALAELVEHQMVQHRMVEHQVVERQVVDPETDTSGEGSTKNHTVTIESRLGASDAELVSSLTLDGTDRRALSLDWIESGDKVCRNNGACDRFFYDAETLDVPVEVANNVAIETLRTPWDGFINPEPATVFVRRNPQEYAVQRWVGLAITVDELPFSGVDDPTHLISGSGSLTGRSTDIVNSAYVYTGDAALDGDLLTFAIDQQIDNALGRANIYTVGSFDLASGSGTQTVVDCVGPALLCSDVVNGSTAFYEADQLDAADTDLITWRSDLVIDLGGGFGTADSTATFTATRTAES